MQHIALGALDGSVTRRQADALKGLAQGVLLPNAVRRDLVARAAHLGPSRQMAHLAAEARAARALLEYDTSSDRLTVDAEYEEVQSGR